ncbi:MAG TPA: helicase C-terminal domain-containing protein [Tepidiformaceae bacterium]|nr:helicase C-terminal domain-containing protein [Tepidiformaceae bacterium]
MTSYVALDLETTGLDPEHDRIIEVGASRFDASGRELDTLSYVVNPGRAVPAFIERFTGVTNEMTAKAPKLASIRNDIERFVGDSVVVGHNIGFDLRYLSGEQVRLKAKAVDTAELARYLLPTLPGHGLAEVARALGLEATDHHRALSDARTAAAVFTGLVRTAEALPAGQRSQLARFVSLHDPVLAEVIAGEEWARQPAGHIPALLPAPDIEALTPRSPRKAVSRSDVAKAFSAAGRVLDGFEERPQQLEMAETVRGAFAHGGHWLVEAGTGVGKSLAYLLPAALHAIANGERVVVSTNTIALQEQLLSKDIPALREILLGAGVIKAPDEFRAALLKGRSNYLCMRRWVANYASGLGDADFARLSAAMLVWLGETETGDRSELNLDPTEWVTWQRFSAQDADCLQRQDRFVREGNCFLQRARQAAESAHILVVNHALLLADLVAGGSALPEFDHLIIDEAHNLEDVATNQFGGSVSLRKATEALDGVHRRQSREHREGGAIMVLRALPEESFGSLGRGLEESVARCGEAARPFFQSLSNLLPGGDDERLLITPGIRHGEAWEAVEAAWTPFETALRGVVSHGTAARKAVEEAPIEGAEALAGEIDAALRKVSDLHAQAAQLLSATADDLILWAARERDGTGTLNVAPLDVGPRLWEELFRQRRVVVATSATLSANNDMGFAVKRLGFEEPETLQLGSPFDYGSSTLLSAVEDVPDPSDRGYLEGVARAIVSLTKASDGRALALFTSNAALRRVAAMVQPELEASGILALAQGVDGTPKRLTEQLRNNPRTLILGTSSFWEGVDIRGDALSLLMITRLPFGVPTDPVFKARSEQYADPFSEYSLPAAILKFRQGFGRLIRDRTDRGVVALLDRRLWEKRYGKQFIDSLPPCTRLKASAEVVAGHTRDWLAR